MCLSRKIAKFIFSFSLLSFSLFLSPHMHGQDMHRGHSYSQREVVFQSTTGNVIKERKVRTGHLNQWICKPPQTFVSSKRKVSNRLSQNLLSLSLKEILEPPSFLISTAPGKRPFEHNKQIERMFQSWFMTLVLAYLLKLSKLSSLNN